MQYVYSIVDGSLIQFIEEHHDMNGARLVSVAHWLFFTAAALSDGNPPGCSHFNESGFLALFT